MQFIDWDWAGRQGTARYPLSLNAAGIAWPPGAAAGELITREHDEAVLRGEYGGSVVVVG